jgi:hypothetical protein
MRHMHMTPTIWSQTVLLLIVIIVPQVVAVSSEASSRKTHSISSARLYSLDFSAAVETSQGTVGQTR